MNESVCNSKQKWNYVEWQCECKELKRCTFYKDDFMRNPGMYNCGIVKHTKLTNTWILKLVLPKKCLFAKLVLT